MTIEHERPIIASLLDLDLYKLTMLQLIWRRHREVPVTLTFKNRTADVLLGSFVQLVRLQREIDHVRTLRFTSDELAYLASLKLFDSAFLVWLRDEFRFSDIELGVDPASAQLRIAASGPWSQVTLWETIVLAIVNELYYREVRRRDGYASSQLYSDGYDRLQEKCAMLMRHSDVKIIEFGTRRRYSREWQRRVVADLRDFVPMNLLGTSNVLLAMELDLKPIGTFAHELDMVYSGIYRSALRGSHQLMLRDWWGEFGEALSIALTDTYTSDFFFEDLTAEQARAWRGLRQDSGDPLAFADKAIAFYERHGVNPKAKTIVFSDGLEIDVILRIADHCRGRVGCAFGWGTNLTNDLGSKPLSLVMKATRANGHGLVKLSDNRAKAQGSPEDIALFTRTFGHAPTTREECTY